MRDLMHPNAEQQFLKYGLPVILPQSDVLEVGPDSDNVIKNHLVKAGHKYTCCDLDHPLQVWHPKFDAVVCSNVIEHVARPWEFVDWLAGLLKTGGILVLGCPNSWPHHPSVTDDYFRIWPAGMRILLTQAGLGVDIAIWEQGHHESVDTIAVGRKP